MLHPATISILITMTMASKFLHNTTGSNRSSIKFLKFVKFKTNNDRRATELLNDMDAHLWNREFEMYDKARKKLEKLTTKIFREKIENTLIGEEFHDDPKFRPKYKSLILDMEEAMYIQKKSAKEARSLKVEILKQDDLIVCPYRRANCDSGEGMDVYDIERVFQTSRDHRELLYYWQEWRDEAGPVLKELFLGEVEKMNQIANILNFDNFLEMEKARQRSQKLMKNIDRLWEEIRPLYENLHRFVAVKLQKVYRRLYQSEMVIPAHLLGDLFATNWAGLYDIAAPGKLSAIFNLSIAIADEELKVGHILKMADLFYQSLGFQTVTGTKHYSQIWSNNKEFFRNNRTYLIPDDAISGEEEMHEIFETVLSFAYKNERNDQPVMYKRAPNQVFEDGVKRALSLRISEKFLKKVGLRNQRSLKRSDEKNLLTRIALKYIPQLAYYYVVDKWRYDVLTEKIDPKQLNSRWWLYRKNVQMLKPPTPRSEQNFDPGGDAQRTLTPEYTSHFLSLLLSFQINMALCTEDGQYNPKNENGKPLHRCDLFRSKRAGQKLRHGLRLGASESWTVVLNELTGDVRITTDAVFEYFKPLNKVFENKKDLLKSLKIDEETVEETARPVETTTEEQPPPYPPKKTQFLTHPEYEAEKNKQIDASKKRKAMVDRESSEQTFVLLGTVFGVMFIVISGIVVYYMYYKRKSQNGPNSSLSPWYTNVTNAFGFK